MVSNPFIQSRACSSLLLVLSLAFACESQAQETYNTIRPLIVQAIDADGETVRGYAGGAIADLFGKAFETYAPVEVEARAIGNFSTPDCKRIELKFIRRGAMTPQGPIDAVVTNQLNICRDGMPPTEGMDLSHITPMLTPPNPIPPVLPQKR